MPMPSPERSVRAWPIGFLLLSLVAAALWVAMLANTTFGPAGGAEDSLSQALEILFLAAGLWIVLVIMLFVGGLMGSMPRRVAWLAIVLVPMAAIADTVAIDMCSRHMEWAVVLVAVLPALVAFYAFWARLPRLQAALPAERTSVAVWGAIFLLSIVTFMVAAY
jgi:hypothetical protein